MKMKLVTFIEANNILSKSQYGFQKNISTQDALIHFSKNIHKQLDKSNSVLSIFIDFSKAFETVPHDILLHKLDHYASEALYMRGLKIIWVTDPNTVYLKIMNLRP